MIYTITLNPALDRTLLCPEFYAGKVNTAEVIGFFPAGKGINVSRCLAVLDVPSVVCGFIGISEHEMYKAFLQKENIRTELTPVQGSTRINTTIINNDSTPETHIKEKGFSVTGDDITHLYSAVSSLIKEDDIAAVSGSLPPGFTDTDLIHLTEICKKNKAQVICDLSGVLLKAVAAVKPSLIKPNEHELKELTGSGNTADMLEKAFHMGFSQILHTRGDQGLIYYNGKNTITAGSPSIAFVNSVGAGDAALAGYIAALYNGLDHEERVKWAAVSGAANAREQFAGVIDKEWIKQILAGS